MSELWQIVIPEETINLITNPSFELGTTGWTAGAGSLAQSSDQQAIGVYSGGYTPSSGSNDGVYYAATLVAATTYTFSVSVYGVTGVPYRLRIRDVTGATDLAILQFAGDDSWRRRVVTFTTGANTSIRLYVEKDGSSSIAEYYLDMSQLEQKSYPTVYCDGDQPGCLWNAGPHQSASVRDKLETTGGRVVTIDPGNYFKIQDHQGFGMAPIDIISDLPAKGNGGDYQDSIARPRNAQFSGTLSGDGNGLAKRKSYHSKRRNLINVINPHKLRNRPFQIRYRLDNRSLAIMAHYDNGLGKGNLIDYGTEKIGLQIKALDPFFRGVAGVENGDLAGGSRGGQAALIGSVQQSVADANYIIQRQADGTWIDMDGGMNASVSRLIYGLNGSLYAGGTYTQAGGNARSRGAEWDGDSWEDLDGGLNTGGITDMARGPDGKIFFTGEFDEVGSGPTAAVPSIASWDPSTGSWTVYSDSVAAFVSAVAIGPDGVIYIAHGSVGSATTVSFWTGAAWSAIETTTGAILDLVIGPGNRLYACGDMTGKVGEIISGTFTTLGAGLPGSTVAMAFGPSGTLYAAYSVGGGVWDISAWNGTRWTSIGANANDNIHNIKFDSDGVMHIVGEFSEIDGITTADGYATWTGSTFFPPDVELPGTASVFDIALAPNGEITLVFSTSGTATAGVSNQLVNNGDANSYPTLRVAGPGQVFQLINYTTGDAIYFDLALNDGEEVVLDLNKKTLISTFRGNIPDAILPGSDTATFHLAPGANDISIFIGDASATAYVLWEELYWSFDGVVD